MMNTLKFINTVSNNGKKPKVPQAKLEGRSN